MVWTRHDREMRPVEEIRIVLPRGDFGERVGSGHEEQFGRLESLLVKTRERRGRVRRLRLAKLAIRQSPQRLARDGERGHGKAMVARSHRLSTMGWDVRREDD